MSKLAQYRSFLLTQGFRPEVRDDFVAFTFEGGLYLLKPDDTDPEFVQVLFPCFWKIVSDDEKQRALAAAAKATAMVKLAKVFPVQRQGEPGGPPIDDITAAIELFVPRFDDLAAVFPRSLRTLQVACLTFAMTMAQSSRLGGEGGPAGA